jgi:plasmid stability protein
MPVSLSIKGVPEALAERLRRRAAGNHRSLQRELLAIVEAAVQPTARAATHAPLPSATPLALRDTDAAVVWSASGSTAPDNLLDELDQIVAGSRWGEAPLLTREQTHDRALAREIDFDARQAEPTAKSRKQDTAR